MAAQFQRESAPSISTSEEQARPARNVYRPTAAPLFSSRGQREPISFSSHNASRRARQKVQQEMRGEKDWDMREEHSAPEDEAPLPATTANAAGTNWLVAGKGSNERRFGVPEAWMMTDENQAHRPKTSEGTRRSPDDRGAMPESRIPRSKTFSPGQRTEASPIATLTDAYRLAEREDANAHVPPGSSDSDTTRSRQGSPSPAAKERRDAKFRAMGMANYSDDDLEKMKGWRQRVKANSAEAQKARENRQPRMEDGNDEYAKTRAKNAVRDARISRLAQSTIPLFAHKNSPSLAPGRVIDAAKELEKRTSGPYDDEPEPPLNVPKQWGSKARPYPGWAQRILRPESSGEMDLPPAGFDGNLRAAADTPLPSVEAQLEPTPPSSRPSSAQPRYGSPEKSRFWDGDIDFTAHSIQISTSPQLRVRKLDQLREQEIQSLTARAVATNRLEEIRERNSEERSVLSESPRNNLEKPTQEPGKQQQPEERDHDRTILDDEGEHIRGTPITIFSAKSYRGNNQATDGEESGHKREDSFDLLRKLSRAASHSPAPSKMVEEMDKELAQPPEKIPHTTESERSVQKEPDARAEPISVKDIDGALETGSGKPVEKPTQEAPLPPEIGLVQNDFKRHSRSSSRPRSDVDPEERITAEAKLFDLPDNKSERNSIRAPSPSPPSSDNGEVDETPKPRKPDPLTLPTPRVTGAFIETPAPTVRQPKKARTSSPLNEVGETKVPTAYASGISKVKDESQRVESRVGRRRHSGSPPPKQEPSRSQQRNPGPRPPLINSANPTTALEDLRRIKLEAQIDDSTLEDFDLLLDVASSKPKESGDKSGILEPLLDLEYDEKGLPLSKKEKERRLERLVLDRMNQHLKNTSSSIRDARQGIERLEQQVSTSLSIPLVYKAAVDDTLYIKVPVPRLWINDPPGNLKDSHRRWFRSNWKFTWLGLILFIFTTWYITESVVCDIWCHPLTASKDTWHYTDPFFPWAIPTKLDQWTGEYASSALYSSWDYLDGLLMGPKKGRRRWWDIKAGPMGPSDWWLGRDGPIGIKYTEKDRAKFVEEDEIV